MSIVNETGACVRRSISLMAAIALVGSVAGSGAVFAQGPAAPPPPPNLDLPTGGAGAGGNTGAGGGAAQPNATLGNAGQGGNGAGANADGGASQNDTPVLLQGTVKTVSGNTVTISVPSGSVIVTRTVDTSDAVYENASGVKVNKFAVKVGDALLVAGDASDPSDTTATLKALIVEKNVKAVK